MGRCHFEVRRKKDMSVIGYGYFCTTSNQADKEISKTIGEMNGYHARWNSPWPKYLCKHSTKIDEDGEEYHMYSQGEPVIIIAWENVPYWWEGIACVECMVITGGHSDDDQETQYIEDDPILSHLKRPTK